MNYTTSDSMTGSHIHQALLALDSARGMKQEFIEPTHQAIEGMSDTWSTPLPLKQTTLNPDYRQWQEMQLRSPMTSQSVTSTPSMADSTSSASASNLGLPVTPRTDYPPLAHTEDGQDLKSLDQSPVPAPAVLQPYGLAAFTNVNGQVAVPGYTVASHDGGDGSLNLSGLTGDGSNGGYGDQGGFGGDGQGGFGGDGQFGGQGNGGYGPPGGDGSGGPPGGGGGGPGNEGPPPPPPPRGKKLSLACHFCRRRKLKCDGVRPECDNCAKRGETCSYDDNVRRRGPGKRTKEMRQRAVHDLDAGPDGQFAAFNLNDPNQQHHMSIPGPTHQPRPIAPAPLDPASQTQQQFHESSVPSSNLPDIDPNIDPALAILGMGLDHNPEQDDVGTGIQPATLADADPARGQKRKSDLATNTSDGKRLRLEDETYDGPLPDQHHQQNVGVGIGNTGGIGVGVGLGDGVPDFSAWAGGEGREGLVDDEDLAKFENDLRRVIQDQAEAEAKALDQGQGQGQGQAPTDAQGQ